MSFRESGKAGGNDNEKRQSDRDRDVTMTSLEPPCYAHNPIPTHVVYILVKFSFPQTLVCDWYVSKIK